MIALLLLVSMFIIAVLRVNMPFGARVEGKPYGQITLSFRERMLLQRTNLYLIGAVILLTTVGGFLRGPLELVAFVAVFGVLMIPARYTITSQGLALNTVVFRSWSDFRSYREERAALVLEAVEGQRDFRMYVLGPNREAAMKALTALMPSTKTVRLIRSGKSISTTVKA